MKKVNLLLVLVAAFSFAVIPSASVIAAKPVANAPKPSPTVEYLGYDISYPQCGKRLPTDHYFGIVGVNGGTAATTNPCMAEQLAWANRSKTGSNQPKIQLYVNTANPGQVISQITTWPTSNTDKTGYTTNNPYGLCTGQNDLACSWQYGWNRSVEANLDRFVPAAKTAKISDNASLYRWWLDVETMNTWQAGPAEALQKNVATLEAMTSYYQSLGASVGLYSTAYQWAEITGNYISSTSNLNGLPNWRPSGASLSNAKQNCTVAPLTTGGYIMLTQYVQKNLDKNHSCI